MYRRLFLQLIQNLHFWATYIGIILNNLISGYKKSQTTIFFSTDHFSLYNEIILRDFVNDGICISGTNFSILRCADDTFRITDIEAKL